MQPLTAEHPEDATEGTLSPETGAGLWSTITFSWLSPLMKKVRPLLQCIPVLY